MWVASVTDGRELSYGLTYALIGANYQWVAGGVFWFIPLLAWD